MVIIQNFGETVLNKNDPFQELLDVQLAEYLVFALFRILHFRIIIMIANGTQQLVGMELDKSEKIHGDFLLWFSVHTYIFLWLLDHIIVIRRVWSGLRLLICFLLWFEYWECNSKLKSYVIVDFDDEEHSWYCTYHSAHKRENHG